MRVDAFAGQTVAVLGLGRSGHSSASALAAGGSEVWAWDDDPARRAAAPQAGVRLVDLAACDWSRPAALVPSPGVPLTFPRPHPVVALARAQGCPVLGDIELFGLSAGPARLVGVTGTNGKSTTTVLIAHILRAAGRQVEVGGNLGTPALDLPALPDGGIYVLEVSSYQLDLIDRVGFDVAVLVNITPDHIDRHGTLEGYVAAKRRVFQRRAGRPQVAVVGVDQPLSAEVCRLLLPEPDRTLVPVAVEARLTEGVFVADGVLFEAHGGEARRVADLGGVATLAGRHNWQNAAAAFAACRALGLAAVEIAPHLATFPGLAHRIERVATVAGVLYVNDSKATNADAAARALAIFDNVFWIAGGRAKEGGIAALVPLLGRVREAFLIGEAADAFAATLDGRVPARRCGDLATAVAAATRAARACGAARPVVLLSPAAASFDQFRDFEARGDAFRTLVAATAAGAEGGES